MYDFLWTTVPGWEDAGLAAINVHDIPGETDCHKNPEKPLSYAVSVQLTPKANWCFFPVLPKARAILSWNAIPTAGDPTYTPVWGNTLDAQIQIRPRPIFLKEIANLNEKVKLVLPPEELEQALQIPIPLPDPGPLSLTQLAKLYQPQTAGKVSAKGSAVKARYPPIVSVLHSFIRRCTRRRPIPRVLKPVFPNGRTRDWTGSRRSRS